MEWKTEQQNKDGAICMFMKLSSGYKENRMRNERLWEDKDVTLSVIIKTISLEEDATDTLNRSCRKHS
jgi:hypothetical protein